MATRSKKAGEARLIKKYPNRRLYDTQTSSYITLVDVKQLVLANEEFTVVDAKTEDDLTRSILLQIILEEEANGQPMFSSSALTQIIRYYGHAMQGMMGSYLEKNLQTFVTVLRDSNAQIVQFQDRLSTVSGVIDGSRSDLDGALTNLSATGTVTAGFSGTVVPEVALPASVKSGLKSRP